MFHYYLNFLIASSSSFEKPSQFPLFHSNLKSKNADYLELRNSQDACFLHIVLTTQRNVFDVVLSCIKMIGEEKMSLFWLSYFYWNEFIFNRVCFWRKYLNSMKLRWQECVCLKRTFGRVYCFKIAQTASSKS